MFCCVLVQPFQSVLKFLLQLTNCIYFVQMQVLTLFLEINIYNVIPSKAQSHDKS